MAVIKDAASTDNTPFTEDDLLPDVPPPGPTTPPANPEEKEDSGNGVAIALGITFGILAALAIVVVGFYFWKKK